MSGFGASEAAGLGAIGFLRRASALALLLAAVLLIYVLAVAPVRQWSERGGVGLSLAQARLVRFESLAGAIGKLQSAYQAVRAHGPVEGLFIDAASPGAASAYLQERLKELIKSSGASVISLFALPATTQEDHRRVGLRVLMTADTLALQQILHGIEAAEPVLIIEKLYVRARTARSRNVTRDLDVEIEVTGFIAKPRPPTVVKGVEKGTANGTAKGAQK